jgi:hypothetical protein
MLRSPFSLSFLEIRKKKQFFRSTELPRVQTTRKLTSSELAVVHGVQDERSLLARLRCAGCGHGECRGWRWASAGPRLRCDVEGQELLGGATRLASIRKWISSINKSKAVRYRFAWDKQHVARRGLPVCARRKSPLRETVHFCRYVLESDLESARNICMGVTIHLKCRVTPRTAWTLVDSARERVPSGGLANVTVDVAYVGGGADSFTAAISSKTNRSTYLHSLADEGWHPRSSSSGAISV